MIQNMSPEMAMLVGIAIAVAIAMVWIAGEAVIRHVENRRALRTATEFLSYVEGFGGISASGGNFLTEESKTIKEGKMR